jgi:hypothetical protein
MGRGGFALGSGQAGPALDAEGHMARKSSYVIGGLAIAAVMIGALPAAQGIGTSTQERPVLQVNRGAKGDRMATPHTIAVKKAPAETAREVIRGPEQTNKRRIMDGCDPMFSPVTVPSLAHVAGRCVG